MLMERTAAVFALAFLLAMPGESSGKSQRAPADIPPVQGPSSQPAQPPAADQRGTDQVPLTVKILPGPEAKEQSEKQERERSKKTENDKRLADQTQRLADDTGWLAIITGFLFSAALGQIILFYWQLKLIGESLIDAKASIELARAEFIVTHRPRLKIHRVLVVGFHKRIPTAPLIPGEELNASLEIVNVGGSDATIIWSRYRIYFGRDDYSLVVHYVPPHSLSPVTSPVSFKPGQRFNFELIDRVPEDIAPAGTMIRPNFGGYDWNMYVIGEVRYQDNVGIIRHLGFCRQMQGNLRFRAVNDPITNMQIRAAPACRSHLKHGLAVMSSRGTSPKLGLVCSRKSMPDENLIAQPPDLERLRERLGALTGRDEA